MTDRMNDDMETRDEASDDLGSRVRDAYESVGLSAEAEERMLAELLEAQEAREKETQAEAVQPKAAKPQAKAPRSVKSARSEAGARRMPSWALPAAACLVIALLVGAIARGTSTFMDMRETSMEASSVEGMSAGASLAEAAQDDDAAASEGVEVPQHARLSDGRVVELVREEGMAVTVDASDAGDALDSGWTLDHKGDSVGSCDFFSLATDEYGEGYCLVRPEGDETLYLARIIG